MTQREAAGRLGAERSSVASFWDELAAHYDTRYDVDGVDRHALTARLQVILRLLDRPPGDALDAGMGGGRLCHALDRLGWRVSGVDISPAMVDIARARLPHLRTDLVTGSIESLPYGDAAFDAVFASGVLEYTDVRRSLGELARVLAPGGTAIVSYPNPRAPYALWRTRVWYPLVRALRRVTNPTDRTPPHGGPPLPPGEFRALLARAGLEVTTAVHTSYIPLLSPLDELFPSLARWVGAWLERTHPRFGPVLGTQVVYAARRQDG